MDWKLFVAEYAVGDGVKLFEIPNLACRLLEEGYDSQSLRLTAWEDWKSPGVSELFDKALHEIGLLPVNRIDAALMLIRRTASEVVANRIDTSCGVARIGHILEEVPELREEEPFVTVTLTLLCDIASRIVTGRISELFGVSQFWSVLEAVPELREQEPFIEISKTEDDMYYYWPYHEARYKSQVQDYAKQILAKYGAK